MTILQVRTPHASSATVREQLDSGDVLRSWGNILTDAAAVAIASWYQSSGTVGSVLASFASGASVQSDDLMADIAATRRATRRTCTVHLLELSALRRWVQAQCGEETLITRINTNNVPRKIIEGYELTAAERAQFDYVDWVGVEHGAAVSASFFRYRGELYDLAEFEPAPQALARLGWNGVQDQSHMISIAVKYVTDNMDDPAVIVGEVNRAMGAEAFKKHINRLTDDLIADLIAD